MNFLFLLMAYLLGSIPFGLLVARAKGVDIRKVGSGNIGATNVARAVGKKEGVLVLVLDLSKGFLSVFLPSTFSLPEWVLALSALLALVGNIASIFLRFRGGKGIATGIGILLALSPKVFGVALFTWLLVASLTGYISLASLFAFATLPLSFHFFLSSPTFSILGLLFFALALLRHRENLRRILSGQEPRTFHDFFKKKKT